jgi:hypothetical protein
MTDVLWTWLCGDLTRHFPALTNTPVLTKLGFDPRTMPMKPMSVEQCVSEDLNALRENRCRIVPGRMNRIMNALAPASVKRTTFRRWFARYEGQTENDFHDAGSDAPAAALGMAILLMEENDAVSDRLWGH